MDPPFEHEGQRYLVSPSGDTYWARNLRAAGEAELRHDGRVEHIGAVELEGDRARGGRYAQRSGARADLQTGKEPTDGFGAADAVISAVPAHALLGLLPEQWIGQLR